MARPRSRSRKYNRENNVVNFEKARKQRAKRREQEETARAQKARKKEMGERRRRQRLRKIIFYGSVAIVLAILMVVASFNFLQLIKEKNDLEKTNKQLKTELEEKEEELKYVDDPEYIEKLVREKLHMVYPGEILYLKREDGDDAD